MRVVVNRKNVSVPDSSHNSMEATTSTIVGATNNTLSRQHQQQQPVFIGACSLIPESPCGTPTGISLFEKLVRTHPIWYLPHIGRVAAVHLLRGKSPGVRIIYSFLRKDSNSSTVSGLHCAPFESTEFDGN